MKICALQIFHSIEGQRKSTPKTKQKQLGQKYVDTKRTKQSIESHTKDKTIKTNK